MTPNCKKAFTIGICIIAICYAIQVLPPSSKGVGGPAQGSAAPYFHSYKEMQVWAEVEPDGIWGPISDKAYRAKRDRVYCDKAALELWPERE